MHIPFVLYIRFSNPPSPTPRAVGLLERWCDDELLEFAEDVFVPEGRCPKVDVVLFEPTLQPLFEEGRIGIPELNTNGRVLEFPATDDFLALSALKRLFENDSFRQEFPNVEHIIQQLNDEL